MTDAVVVAAARTPIGRAPKGMFRTTRPDDLAALVLAEVLRRVPELDPAEVEDVILGCAMPEGSQGLNVARLAGLLAGIPYTTSAMTVNRFCSSGLQAIALADASIKAGHHDIVVAGGAMARRNERNRLSGVRYSECRMCWFPVPRWRSMPTCS